MVRCYIRGHGRHAQRAISKADLSASSFHSHEALYVSFASSSCSGPGPYLSHNVACAVISKACRHPDPFPPAQTLPCITPDSNAY